MNDGIKIHTGGIGIRIKGNNAIFKPKLKETLLLFQSDEPADIEIEACFGHLPQLELKELIFETGSAWRLYKLNGEYVFIVPSDDCPERIAVFDADFSKGRVYLDPERLNSDCLSYPLWYPLDELIVINRLYRQQGVLVHSCGINNKGKGILFAGVSGAGKSTLANLLKSEDVDILSDDRVIVRKERDRFWIYGTPWHGDANVCSAGTAPLEKIFFIKHTGKNQVIKINPFDALQRLMICCFPTFWIHKGMETTLEICNEIVEQIECSELLLGDIPQGDTPIAYNPLNLNEL